jgi:protein-tyrosine phosphatase
MKRVLFLCTGNYYRSRYAEELFNHLARCKGLNWVAISRALALERGVVNVGPIARSTLDALATDEIELANGSRFPLPCKIEDLLASDLVVAVKETEHRELLANRFPGWEDRVVYWHVHDLDFAPPSEALGMLRQLVHDLARDLHV